MSYQFPRRVLRDQDVLDPIELTQDISPAAERLSGRLNAHNFKETIAASVGIDPEAFYAVQHYAYFVQFAWSHAAPENGYPDTTAGNAYQVQNNFEWNVVTEPGGTPSAVTITTGNSVLWINAYAQYLWHGFAYNKATGTFEALNQHANNCQDDSANIQFALRVDGNIIDESMTGIEDVVYRPSVPIKPVTQRVVSGGSLTKLPGPQDIRGEQTVALGPPCLPVRVGALVPVQSGTHTVELVVRRAPLIRANEVSGYKSTDKVYVYNRQVNVVDLKSFPVDSVGGSEVSAPGWDEEDPITNATIYTQRVQPVIAGYNDVKEGNLARGALMHYHLPATLLANYTVERTYAGEKFNSVYPGNASPNVVTTARYAGAPATGWTLITDGANPVRVAPVSITGRPKLLVLANAQVRNVQGGFVRSTLGGADAPIAGNIAAFALFQIMWQRVSQGATEWTRVSESMGMVNNFVWWPADPTQEVGASNTYLPVPDYGLEQVEIQLMALIDTTTVGSEDIRIGLFGATNDDGALGSTATTATNVAVEYEIRFASMTVLALRA